MGAVGITIFIWLSRCSSFVSIGCGGWELLPIPPGPSLIQWLVFLVCLLAANVFYITAKITEVQVAE
jgi:hypothetical protein